MAHTAGGAADTWVPVERRWLGLDRRTLLPGLLVLALALLLRSVVPLIDRAVPGHDVVRAGDRFDLGAGLSIAPPVGWQIVDGILVGARTVQPGTGSPTAAVVRSGISAQMAVSTFAGDAGALLDQINRNDERSGERPAFTADSDRTAITATGEVTGLAESYTSTSQDGVIAAYTFPDDRGLAVEVVGDRDQLAARSGQIDAMLRSVSLESQP